MASGCTFTDLHHSFRLGVSTIAEIIREVCFSIWHCFKDICLKLPTTEEWLQIAEQFNTRANFPNCVGAIDGKHVRVIKPRHSGSLNYNYKNYFSFVLLAVCDADFNFIYINVGGHGKDSDSSIFKDSLFYSKLMSNTLQLPENKPISENSPIPMPFVFVGDAAFGLSDRVMRPYGGTHLTAAKRIFNYRLSRARRYVECSFGILANKWRIFHRPMNVNTDIAIGITKACCVLHNYTRKRDGYRFEDTLSVPGLLNGGTIINEIPRPRGRGCYYRDLFADYFVNEGRLEWQVNVV